MNVIPVLDLKDGQVVHAKRGNRQAYLPIQSALTQSSDAIAIVEALLSLYPFKQLYIADIDAIQGTGHHAELVKLIQSKFTELEIWLDAGFATTEAIKSRQGANIRIVLGSESLESLEQYQALAQYCKTQPVLSLDFKSGVFLGSSTLLESPKHWPKNVIVMSLDQVGSQAGPDTVRLSAIKNQAPLTSIYAAGGIRSTADLAFLREQNVAGALIASSLHNQSINTVDLAALR